MQVKTNLAVATLFLIGSLFIVFLFSPSNKESFPVDLNKQIAQVGSTLTNGLVAYYNFDEGAGTAVGDSVGSNTGTLVNGPSWTNGKIGSGALSFDGVNDSINLGNIINLSTGSMTISVWMKSNSDARQVVVAKTGSKFSQFELLSGSVARFYITDGVITHNAQFPISLSDGDWHHLVWVVDRNKTIGQVYFDGIEKVCNGNCVANLSSLGDVTSTGPLYISGNPKTGWNGSLDEIRVYNRALSKIEITELYNLGYVSAPTLTPVNGSCGPSAKNYSVSESFPFEAYCSTTGTPTPATPTDPIQGTSSTWTCLGLNNGSTSPTCTASRQAAADPTPSPQVVTIPTITSYTVSPSTIERGQSATLSWVTTNATALSINQSVGIVTGASVSVSPTQTAVYVLTATNGTNSVTSNVTITVTDPPVEVSTPVVDEESVAILAGALNLIGQKDSAAAYWSYYNGGDSPEGAYMGWMFAGASSLNGRITLPKTLIPGRYYVFVKGIAYYPNMRANLSLGGSNVTVDLNNNDFNKYWSTAGAVDITSPSNILTVQLLKAGALNTEEKYLIRGIYITQNSTEVVFKDDTVMDLNYPTVMDLSEPIKKNVFENSSFEVGTGHGWAISPMRGVSQASL